MVQKARRQENTDWGIGATSLPCLRSPLPVIPPNSRPMLAPILSYEDLGLIQGSGWLFQGLDLYIGERDRLALIGRNGAGKTTLLKLIPGSVDRSEERRVGKECVSKWTLRLPPYT